MGPVGPKESWRFRQGNDMVRLCFWRSLLAAEKRLAWGKLMSVGHSWRRACKGPGEQWGVWNLSSNNRDREDRQNNNIRQW